MAKQEKSQKNLVRIAGTDIDANLSLLYGFAKVTGVSVMFSNALCAVLSFDKNAKVASLSEKDIEKVETFLASPKKEGIPTWLLNQRRDLTTGEDLHYAARDIEFNLLQYKRRIFKLKTYKGLRHKLRLPVRGQRTKSNFRRNKTLASIKSKRGDRK